MYKSLQIDCMLYVAALQTSKPCSCSYMFLFVYRSGQEYFILTHFMLLWKLTTALKHRTRFKNTHICHIIRTSIFHISLTQLSTTFYLILMKSIYVFQNYKINPTYRKYYDQIPPYLHG